MAEQRRVAQNTGILMAMELGIKVFEILVSILVARYLAPQGFGLMAFALAFVSLFSLIPGFGMNVLVTRDVAQGEEVARYLTNGLLIKAFLSTLAVGIILGVGGVMHFSPERLWVVFLASLLMIFEDHLCFAGSFFRAKQQMKTVALTNLGLHAGMVLATLGVLAMGGRVSEILAARGLVYLIVIGIAFRLIHVRIQRIGWHVDPRFAMKILRDSVPFALFKVFISIYVDIDMVMLSAMRGDVMTGWYAAAQKFRQALTFIPMSVTGAVMPALATFSRESKKDYLETLAKSCKYLLMIALPVAVGISIIADRLIPLLYGRDYLPAIPALRVVIWTIFFSFINSVLSSALVAVHKERQVSWALGAGALFNLVTNFIAIPLWGHVGAAATTVLSEALVLFVQMRILQGTVLEARPLSHSGRILLATAVMMAIAFLTRGLPLALNIASAASAYVGGLLMLKTLTTEEWLFLKNFILLKEDSKRP